jgi:hypothetical protein
MKSSIKILLAAGLISAFSAVSVKAAGPVQDVVSYPLMASQIYTAGTVTVWHDDDTLYIKYETTNGWTLTSTAAAVAADLSGFPKNGNNPAPGQFPYQDAQLPPGTTVKIYTINLNVLNLDHMVIATHANVTNGFNSGTAWAGDLQFPGGNWAKYFAYNITPDWWPEE